MDMTRLRYSYTTMRYGRIISYHGEIYCEGYIYKGIGNQGDAHWVDSSGHVERIALSDIPPAPYAPRTATYKERRLLHFLTWGMAPWLTKYGATEPYAKEVIARAYKHAQAMAAGKFTERPASIWYRRVIEDLHLVPENMGRP